MCNCKRSHAEATVTQPQGSGKGWKEYTPCLLEGFYSGIPRITLQSTVTQPALRTAGCRGPLVAMCWAPSPLYCPELHADMPLFTAAGAPHLSHTCCLNDTSSESDRPAVMTVSRRTRSTKQICYQILLKVILIYVTHFKKGS